MHKQKQSGMTLLEIVFSLTLIVFLVSSISFIYLASLRGWDNLGHRTDLHEKLHFTLERILRDVRSANAISVSNHAVRFTLNESGVDNSYVYYLYHQADSWPPAFNQTTYELRRTSLSGGLSGTFTYGTGELIATGIKPPSSTSITGSGNTAILQLAALQEDDTLTVSGYVRPRNIP